MKINKQGFTLMEILIVVIIISGFAAMIYPVYTSAIERARASEAVNMLGAIQAAQEKHYVMYEEYATTFKDIRDFSPSIDNFDLNSDRFNTEYFLYQMDSTNNTVTATRILPGQPDSPADKGYGFAAKYEDGFIECTYTTEDGDKVCASLTDHEATNSTYKIY